MKMENHSRQHVVRIYLITLITIIIFETGCNFKLNPTHGKIEIWQSNSLIEKNIGVFDFGTTLVAESSPEIVFKITNVGTRKLHLTGIPKISIAGYDSTAFSINQSMIFTPVLPGNSTVFSVKFNPEITGDRSAVISIENSDDTSNPYAFKITGKGITPEINVKQGSTAILSKTGVYDFGLIDLNKSSPEITFTIENLGTSNLNLTGSPKIQISGSNPTMFIINQSMTRTLVGPGLTTTFTIIYKPTSGGDKSAIISIANDDLDENPYTFKIIGNCKPLYCWTKMLGGFYSRDGCSIALDKSGNIYVTGPLGGTMDFGVDFGVSDIKTTAGNTDIFVTRINADKTYGWTKRMGGINYDESHAITTDTSGNVYVTGTFRYSVNFGADFGVTDIKTPSNDSYDIFVTKIKANGTYGWTKRMGGTGNDGGISITTDLFDNIFITGFFQGRANFGEDFGVSDVKNTAGVDEIFVTKINNNGTYSWTIRMGGTQWDFGSSIVTDLSGNIYVTGGFYNTVNFGEDFGVSDIKTSAGVRDIFITKISSNGTYGWTKRIGSVGGQVGVSIATDTSSNVFVTGVFTNSVNFGEDFGLSDIKTTLYEHPETFILKINANGSYAWTKHIRASASKSITSISTGDIFVTGSFGGTVNFGEDFGKSDSKTSKGTGDVYIMKINASGTYGWTKRIGGEFNNDIGFSIATDLSDNIYISGFFRETVNFGEDFGVSDVKTATNSSQVFVTKICQ